MRRLRLALQVLVGLAVVTIAFGWVLPSFADYGDVAQVIGEARRSSPTGWVVALVIVGTANLIAPSVSQMAALPGLTLRRAVAADWATTTVTNLIPGGSGLAIGLIWAMYRTWGLASAAIARSIVVTGVWDALVKLGTPLVAVVWLATERPVEGLVTQAAIVGAVLFLAATALSTAVLAAPSVAAAVGRVVDRIPLTGDRWGQRLESARRDTISLLADRGLGLTWWTVAGHLNLYLLLLVCLRLVGLDGTILSPAAVATAFAFGRLITALPLTPGGIGMMEVGLTGTLSALATARPEAAQPTEAAIVAAVMVFRFCSYALPVPLGALTLAWWTTNRPANYSPLRSDTTMP